MERQSEGTPLAVIERMQRAIEGHDLEGLAACFASDYASEFPAHPDRIFHGQAQMRKNWAQIFGGVPDLTSTLVRCVADGETVWAEWDWRGSRRDGAPFAMRGVVISGVQDDHISWVRMYMEPVQVGDGTDVAVRRQVMGVGA